MGGFRPHLGTGGVPGGGLPAGVSVGDIMFWNGAAWVPNAEGLPDVGSVLVWDGASWVPTVGEVIPEPDFDGQILVALGGNWVSDFTFAKSTQTTWSVNTTTGSDLNQGTAASPLATYEEFFRRWSQLIVDASVAAIAITFTGDPPAGTPLILDGVTLLGPTVVTVSGTMTQTDSGSITAAFTAWNGAAAGADGTRAVLTDAAQDFTASVLRRIRMTSGVANGSVSNVMSLGAGVTLANVGQFCSTTPATTNPANGDTYVIETPDVTFAGYQIHPNGNGTFFIRDLEFVSVAPITRSSANVGGDPNRCVFFGCRFVGSVAGLVLNDKARFAGCSTEGNFVVIQGNPSILNSCSFGFVQVNAANCAVQAWAFDGGAARNAALFVGNGSYLEAIGGSGNFGLAFYGVINGTGTALLTIQDFATAIMSNTASNFIGSTGNATTNAMQVFNGSGFMFVTLPKAEEALAGVANVVLAGAAAITWAACAGGASAAPPDNAYAVLRR